ncbi:MAG: TonB-dependent receptor [Ignavibacteriae bacterium]|nr:TonB-dependent receptor [Ignavibacteriota bacterium]
MYKTIIALLLFIVCSSPVFSQQIHGKVFGHDNGTHKPLAGASIRWLGTNKGAITKSDGSFAIERASTDTLVASYVGYMPDTTIISVSQVSVEITLIAGFQTKEVSITAETGTTISNAVAKTEEISNRKLEQSACCSLAESFEKSPSVEVSFSDAATGARQIQLLGLRGIYTQILTEAIPTIRGMATNFGLEYIPGAFIKSISISKGAASVTNGYEGITGQININYKQPQDDIPFFANVYGNSMERVELNLTSVQNINENWQTMAMVHGRIFNHEQDGNDDGFIDMPKFKQLNGIARVFHRSEGGNEFQLLTKGLHDEYTSGTTTHGIQSETDHEYEILTRTNRFEFFSKFGINPLFESPETNFGFQLSGAWHDTYTQFGDRDKEFKGLQKTLQAKAILSTEFTDIKFIYGLSYLFDNYDEKFIHKDFSRNESVPGMFAEATYSGISSLTVVGGIRADYHNTFGTFFTSRIHTKYEISDVTFIRFSTGNGTRIANVVSDNLSAFANTREIIFGNSIQPEKAWNYGMSFTTSFELFSKVFTFDAEFYRTDFLNQVVVDLDNSESLVIIDNLKGTSYSNSGLIQLNFAPISTIDLNISYRLIDSKATTGGKLQERPLISPQRVLATASWTSPEKEWQIDGTAIWNSGGRIPSTVNNPDSLRFPDNFDSFFRMNAQITKRFEIFDIYLGVENISNFIQKQAVISPKDPHNEFFDASLVWGPLDNRLVYIGARLRIE